jgi:hypothetical protein
MTTKLRRRRGMQPVPPARLADFFRVLAETASVSTACERTGLRRSTVYQLRDGDPAFAARWTESLALGVEQLEDNAMKRAIAGVERPVWRGGEQVGSVTHYDNRLLQFLLKAHRPQTYDRPRGAAGSLPFDLIKRVAAAEKRMAAFEAPEKPAETPAPETPAPEAAPAKKPARRKTKGARRG